MKDLDFPLFKTKSDVYKKFDMTDVKERQEYFEYKAGEEIKKLREYLKENTFVAYFLGKKSSGKGTYAKMLAEVVDKEKIAHFSIGDMVRSFDEIVQDPVKKKEFADFLQKNYRGYLTLTGKLHTKYSWKFNRIMQYQQYNIYFLRMRKFKKGVYLRKLII